MFKRILLAIVINAMVLYIVADLLPEYFSVEGGVKAYAVCGLILGILNGIVRPLLKLIMAIITLPFLLLSSLIIYIVVNGTMLWMLDFVLSKMAIDGVVLSFHQGSLSFLFIAVVFGFINAIMHVLFH